MSHPTLDQLVALRERGLEPGLAEVRAHVEGCRDCQLEAARLDQRVARFKALPTLRPARDHWPVIRERVAAERRRRRLRWAGAAALAAAAGVAVVVAVRSATHVADRSELAIQDAMTRSHQLEQLIESYAPERRVTDGVTARVAGDLEDRIAVIDRQLEVAQMLQDRQRQEALSRLWRQRVGLLDALVDVHLTRASEVAF